MATRGEAAYSHDAHVINQECSTALAPLLVIACCPCSGVLSSVCRHIQIRFTLEYLRQRSAALNV